LHKLRTTVKNSPQLSCHSTCTSTLRSEVQLYSERAYGHLMWISVMQLSCSDLDVKM